MLKQLFLYNGTGTDPYENLATEYRLLTTCPPDSCILYLWQNRNTVVIGKNQNAWSECRVSLLEAEGGKLARRLSGGGAVFHDDGNLNFTFLCGDEHYDLDKQFSVIARACALAGIPVERSGRNDLLAAGRKFSGNAFYHHQGRSYHHGTLLIRADTEKLGRYLSPPKAKLEAKGVSSVRSRIMNLTELVPSLTCDQMRAYMTQSFQEVYDLPLSLLELDPKDLEAIAQKKAEISGWEYLFGTRLPFTYESQLYLPFGTVQVGLQAASGLITCAKVYTDAMDWTLSSRLETALTGCQFRKDAIESALRDAEPDEAAQLIRLFEDI